MNLMGQYLAPRKNSTGGYDPSIPVWLLRSGRGTRFEIAAFKNSRKASDQQRIVHLCNADSKQQMEGGTICVIYCAGAKE